jgi:SAM-dependent methyltransferase
MNKGDLSWLLRKVRLLRSADGFRFVWFKLQKSRTNRRFKREHPDWAFPEDYALYETYALDYQQYYEDGLATANWLMGLWTIFSSADPTRILDWGCGPGRVVRHLPRLLTGKKTALFGTDMNRRYIQWCRSHLTGIQFDEQNIAPPLLYPDQYFDVVYGISIFTHLSERLHADWAKELHRVMTKGGILLVTTSGEQFRTKLTRSEIAAFDSGDLVVRGKVTEGHRTFSAFQPPPFMTSLFNDNGFSILKHLTDEGMQDVWIVQK